MENRPFYNKLYADMIRDKYPDKASICNSYLQKENWTALDVIQVNELLFGSEKRKQDHKIDKIHRAYDEQSISQILTYQMKNKLNNNQIADRFGLSRNTVAKWKKLFPGLCEVSV